MKKVIIPLDEPLVWHEGTVSEIILREPTFNDVMELGDLSTIALSQEGTRVVVENTGTYAEYLKRCLVQPANVAALEQVSGRTAIKVRRVIDGFFREGDPAPSSTGASPTSSSSDTAS